MSALPAERSNGGRRGAIGWLTSRAEGATSVAALSAVVISVARATDNLREEVADNTASVDALCADISEIKSLLQRILAKVGE